MLQIAEKIQPATEHKLQSVNKYSICDITAGNQYHWHFYIFIKKDFIQKAIAKSNIHVNKGIKANHTSIKNINQETAEKSYEHSFLFSSHKSKRYCEDQKQIGNDGSDGQCLEHGSL